MIIKASATHIPLKDESVHCIVTSPPYFGLRRYDIPDSIWDGDLGCEHEWGDKIVRRDRGSLHGENASVGNTLSGISGIQTEQGSFCLKCSAWQGQLGGEPQIDLYVSHLVQIFREVRRVLRSDGVLWLNLGDSYASGKGSCYNPGGGERSLGKHLKIAGVHYLKRSNISDLRKEGLKPKDLCMIPARVALALQADGWWLRSMIPWLKKNSMPESVDDRLTANVEYIFLLSKSNRYFYDAEAVKISASLNSHDRGHGVNPKAKMCGRNSRMFIDRDVQHQSRAVKSRQNESFSAAVKGLVSSRNLRSSDFFFQTWQGLLSDDEGSPLAIIANPQSYKGAHYSVFPEALIEPMIKAGTSKKGCCPKCGAPWIRVVEKGLTVHDGNTASKYQKGSMANRLSLLRQAARERGEEYQNQTKTVGWQPTCSCDAGDPVPCVVMDPFAGSGTTGVVAEKLNRRWVGLDLGYLGLQRERLVGVQKEMPLIG